MRGMLAALATAAATTALLAGGAPSAGPADWTVTSLKQRAGVKAPDGLSAHSLVRSKTRLYVATCCAGGQHDIFRSDDGGARWQRITPPAIDWPHTRAFLGLAADPGDPNRLFATSWDIGVYGTADGGKTWWRAPLCSQVSGGKCVQLDAAMQVAVDPSDAAIVYAGARGGVWKSTDGGRSFLFSAGGTNGLKPSEITSYGAYFYDESALFVDPASPSVVLAAISNAGIFRSTDGGKSFAKAMGGISLRPLTPETTPDKLVAVGGFVYDATTKSIVAGMKTTVYRSTDHGATWTPSGKGIPPNNGINADGAIAQSPVDPKLFAWQDGWGLYGSSDSGRSWVKLKDPCCNGSGSPNPIGGGVFDARQAATIYWGSSTNGVYKTTNGAGVLGRTAQGFAGTWKSSYGTLTLTQRGATLTGSYTYRKGTISGTVSGKVARGTWTEAPSRKPPRGKGAFVWSLAPDGASFTGTWGYGSRASGGGAWKATRMP